MKRKSRKKIKPQCILPDGMFFVQVKNKKYRTDHCFLITKEDSLCICELEETCYESVLGDGFKRLSFEFAGPEEEKMRIELSIKWDNIPSHFRFKERISSREDFSAKVIEFIKDIKIPSQPVI